MPPKQKRRFSAEFKAGVVKACQQPGTSVSSVATANGINTNMLRRWVKEHELGLPWSDQLHPRQRVRFPAEFKCSIVEQCVSSGMKVTEVAYANRLSPNTVFDWVKKSLAVLPALEQTGANPKQSPDPKQALPAPDGWLPVAPVHESTPLPALLLAPAPGPKPLPLPEPAPGQIDIELNGARLQLRGAVDLNALRVLIEALR